MRIVTGRYVFKLPFGEEIFAGTGGRTPAQGYTASDDVRQKFTSKERDNETGLDYFGARYYSSTQGRFSGTDPIPVTKESFLNPQRWNLYTYVTNNPLTAVDPNGGDGQSKGGEKTISVFLDYGIKDLGTRTMRNEDTKKEYTEAKRPAEWQAIKGEGYKIELFGRNEVTGNKGLPDVITNKRFEDALKTSDLVIYAGHGTGDTGRIPFQQQSIKLGLTDYTPAGPKPEVNASVVGNFSCDANGNGGSYFTWAGENQIMVTLDSRYPGDDGGSTTFDAIDKATHAFVKTYVSTKGDVQKAIDAANAVLRKDPGTKGVEQNVGDEVRGKKVN